MDNCAISRLIKVPYLPSDKKITRSTLNSKIDKVPWRKVASTFLGPATVVANSLPLGLGLYLRLVYVYSRKGQRSAPFLYQYLDENTGYLMPIGRLLGDAQGCPMGPTKTEKLDCLQKTIPRATGAFLAGAFFFSE